MAAAGRRRWAGVLVVQRSWSGVGAQPVHGSVESATGPSRGQAPVVRVAGHQATSWQTGQVRWRLRRFAAGLAGRGGQLELISADFRDGDWQAVERPHLLVTGMRGYTESGVIGRPSLATAEKGRALLNSLARSFKDHLALLL
jgi:hypothetical protein